MSNTKQSPERRALSVGEAARAVGLNRATLYRLIGQKAARDVESRRAGGSFRSPRWTHLLEKAGTK